MFLVVLILANAFPASSITVDRASIARFLFSSSAVIEAGSTGCFAGLFVHFLCFFDLSTLVAILVAATFIIAFDFVVEDDDDNCTKFPSSEYDLDSI